MDDEAFVFAEDALSGEPRKEARWTVLSVEDDDTYQASLMHSLRGLDFRGLPVRLLTASSAAEAAAVLSSGDDIGLILLDVVMEEDDAGLRLVQSVREVLGNPVVRIVLLTGQPGMAPRTDVMQQYDIDEYWNKADLTREKLHAVVRSHLRTWHYMMELQRARKSLQMIIDASRSLYSKQNLTEFTQSLLNDIGLLIGVNGGGIVCSALAGSSTSPRRNVIAASGRYQQLLTTDLSDQIFARFADTLAQAEKTREHQFAQDHTVLYFETASIDGSSYLVLIDSNTMLTEGHIRMLQVFSENIRTGFANVALLNRVSQLAYYDEKLNIINRNGLSREISNMNAAERSSSGLLLVKIRKYTDMMITFGERYCDYLLLRFCDVIAEAFSAVQNCASIGDGNFVLIFDQNKMPADDYLRQQSEQMLEMSGVVHHLLLTFCKVDLGPLQDLPAQEILHLAESALSAAEMQNLPLIDYADGYRHRITSSFLLLQELQQALLNNELCLMFQPKVDLESGRALGFEALVRWPREDGSMVPPDKFIPLAEASGLISSLDEQVFHMTVDAVNELCGAGYELPVSFNTTVSDLRNRSFTQMIMNTVTSGRIDAALLDIEITESEAMADYSGHYDLLKQFIDLGMGVSIDDFGTGYSSLSHIARLAATTLKIDQSFVNGLGQSEDDLHVVQMICRIGKRFNFRIVAEGIETEEQCQLLRRAGCHVGQGYLFARPMKLPDAMEWLRKQA